MSSSTKHHLKNLSSSWFGSVANLIVLMYLSQFVVKALGENVFGVWAAIVAITGVMGLIDIGMRNSLGRFINFHLGQDKIENVNGVISTSLVFFGAMLPIILLVAFLVGTNTDVFFRKIPHEYRVGIQTAMLIAGANLWIGLIAAPFSLIVTSHERFEVFNLVNLGTLAIRAAGTIIVLNQGHGIVALASVQVVSGLFAFVTFAILAKRIFPALKIGIKLSDFATFQELFGFGKWAAVAAVATQLLYRTDIIIISSVLGPKMVTLYSIPLTLIEASRNFVGQVTEILAPKTIKLSSRKDLMALQMVLKWGSKFTMFFAIPVFAGIIFFGPKFMVLFWGPPFEESKWVLIILAIPQFFTMAVRIGGSIISGLGHIRFAAALTLFQAVTNFVLTLIFVLLFSWGIKGVAVGTLIPMVIVNVYLIWVLHRWLKAPVMKFFRNNVFRWVIAIVGVFVYAQGLKVALFELSYDYAQLSETWGGFLFVAILYIVGAVGISWFLSFHDLEREIMSQEIWALIPDRLKKDVMKKDE